MNRFGTETNWLVKLSRIHENGNEISMNGRILPSILPNTAMKQSILLLLILAANRGTCEPKRMNETGEDIYGKSGFFDKPVFGDPIRDLTRRHAQESGRLRLDPSCFPEGFSKTVPFDCIQARGECWLGYRAVRPGGRPGVNGSHVVEIRRERFRNGLQINKRGLREDDQPFNAIL